MKNSDTIYKKVGRKYVPVGHEWRGFPADGVWLVHGNTDHKTCIMSWKDLQNVHLPSYAALCVLKDDAISAAFKRVGDSYSANDFVHIFLQELCRLGHPDEVVTSMIEEAL